jgi:tRNA G18 (ribose-2'-O)-methylase SpoU
MPLSGCVNPWDGKVIRGSMGSVFRLPIIERVNWSSLWDLVTKEDAVVHVADSRGYPSNTKALNYCKEDYGTNGRPIVLVLGGETQGVSKEALELLNSVKCASAVHIPLAHGVESLNVAGAAAVLLFEIRKQWLLKNEHAKGGVINFVSAA